MVTILRPDKISSEIKFDFTDSCNCRCCFPSSNQQLYLNKHGELEKFDRKKAQGHENSQSYERMEAVLRERIKRHSKMSEQIVMLIRERAEIDFDVMASKSIPLSPRIVRQVNKAIVQVFQELMSDKD